MNTDRRHAATAALTNTGRARDRRRAARTAALPALALLTTAVASALGSDTAGAQVIDAPFDVEDVLLEREDGAGIFAKAVAVDSAGNRYVIGRFDGTVGFGEGRRERTLIGGRGDMFVARYDAEGALDWVQLLDVSSTGALPSSDPAGIAFDERRETLVVAGTYQGQLTIGSDVLSSGRKNGGFVARLDPENGEALWANPLTSIGQVEVEDLAADGKIAVTGFFDAIAEFRDHFGSVDSRVTLSGNGSDMYVAVYARNGALDFVLQAGGEGAEAEGASVDIGPGTLNVGGDFEGRIAFPDRSSRPPRSLSSAGESDGFLVSYDLEGRQRLAQRFGGPDDDTVRMVTAKGDEAYVAGNFRGRMIIGSGELASRGETDVFVAQVERDLGRVTAFAQIGGTDRDFVHGMDADGGRDATGVLFVGGEFGSPSLSVEERGRDGAIEIANPNGASSAYLAGFDVDAGTMRPSFGQAVAGRFVSRDLSVDEAGESVFLPGHHGEAIVFGEGNGRIELPEPNGDAMAIARYTPGGGRVNPSDFLISWRSGGSVGGIDFADEDVLLFSTGRQRFATYLDGSDLGLADAGIDAVHVRLDGSLLLSVDRGVRLPELGEVRDSDVLRFVPEQLGDDTRGTLEMFLRGATVGLGGSGEDIDALSSDADGRLLVSTLGTARVPGESGEIVSPDEDMLALEGDRWTPHVDGSAIGLRLSAEDIKAARLDADSLTFATLGEHVLDDGRRGTNDELVRCLIEGGGAITRVRDCSVVFDGAAHALAANRIDAFSVAP